MLELTQSIKNKMDIARKTENGGGVSDEQVRKMINQFNLDFKVMRHKLKCIGGSDESHTTVTNKGRIEIDVIPSTYIYVKVPVQGQLTMNAKLIIEYEPGSYVSKKNARRRDSMQQ